MRVVGLAGGGDMVRVEAEEEVWFEDVIVAKIRGLVRRADGSERG